MRCAALASLMTAAAAMGAPSPSGMVRVPSGSLVQFMPAGADKRAPVAIASFDLDALPVTNAEYGAFVTARPAWKRGAAKSIYVDEAYLAHWATPDAPEARDADRPVTGVSWFAARAYCRWLGKRLPTVDEWEYAATPGGSLSPSEKDKVLDWYAHPATAALPIASETAPNALGLRGMHGVVWEWTEDFSSVALTTAKGKTPDPGQGFVCGGGAADAADASDYAAFMRFAYRQSLKAAYSTGSLGFRCAKDPTP
jgi:formylglycine-generating enzyme required for sulfatase activity